MDFGHLSRTQLGAAADAAYLLASVDRDYGVGLLCHSPVDLRELAGRGNGGFGHVSLAAHLLLELLYVNVNAITVALAGELDSVGNHCDPIL